MKRRKQDQFNHSAQASCHNHLNGSAHCLECGGPCTVRDNNQAALISIVRAVVEAAEFAAASIPYYLIRTLAKHGIDVPAMRRAAKEAAQNEEVVQ